MNNSCKLVVAEDEENDFVLLEAALIECPWIRLIHRCRDGREMIEYISGNSVYADREQYPWPDLLLLDLNMPVCDGFAVLRWLEQHSFSNKPRVVVMSSSLLEADRERAFSLGADDYHVKPINHDQLVTILKQISDVALCRFPASTPSH